MLRWLTLALLLLLVLPGCRKQEQEPVRIGFNACLTGRSSGLGVAGRDGFLLAIEQANDAGGFRGRKIEPLIYDNALDAEKAAANTEEIFSRGAVAMVAPMTSQMAKAAVPVADRLQKVVIGPTVSSNELVGLDDYFFRVYYTNAQAARMVARHIHNKTKLQNMVAVYDLANRAYTEDWIDTFSGHLAEGDERTLVRVPFDSREDFLFSDLAREVAAYDPDGILVLANAVDTAILCQQLYKQAVTVPKYATGWSFSDDLISLGGKSVEGLKILHSLNLRSERDEYVDFRRSYQQRFNEVPGFAAAHAFDATRVILKALEQVGPKKGLKTVLLETETFPGVQQDIRFDEFGDLVDPPLNFVLIENARFRAF